MNIQVDRWVLPPAIAAAVFTVVAIVPPGGQVARGLRIEAVGTVLPDRPLLLRLLIEDAGTSRWRAPGMAQIRVKSASGEVVSTQARAVRGAPYLFARVAPKGPRPFYLEVHSEGFSAQTTLSDPLEPFAVDLTTSSETLPIELAIEGLALVPEVPAGLLVRVASVPRHTVVQITPTEPFLEIRPAQGETDECGVAEFIATARGLDAHVVVTVASDVVPVAHRRLAVMPGGLSVRSEGGTVIATTAVGGQMLYLLTGDRLGPLFWEAGRLEDPSDRNASARFEVPKESEWALVSFAPTFDPSGGTWITTPGTQGCTATPMSQRFERIRTSLPRPPLATLIYDGAGMSARAREVRKSRARHAALGAVVLALAMLLALILFAGFRSNPKELVPVAAPTLPRVLLALAAAGLLLIGGWVLLTAYALRM